MAQYSATISYSSSSAAADCFKIEQEPWPADIGETSTAKGIEAIAAAVNGGRWPEVSCAGSNGMFTAIVYVYPCVGAPRHRFRVSHGRAGPGIVQILWREEVVQCSLKLEQQLDYPSLGHGLVSWIGKCYTAEGIPTAPPSAVVDGNTVTFSKKVFGSLRVRYSVRRYVYGVTVTKRTTDIENKYESVAYVTWDGGVVWQDIDPPAKFEAFDGDCGNGAFYDPDQYGTLSQTDICRWKHIKIPTAVEADRELTVDYCSQEETGDKITERVTDFDSTKECE